MILIREHNLKLNLSFLNKNMLLYSKEPSHWDGSFEQPKHMFILMDKKIITVLFTKIFLILKV